MSDKEDKIKSNGNYTPKKKIRQKYEELNEDDLVY